MFFQALSAVVSVASAVSGAKSMNRQIDAQNAQAEEDMKNARKAGSFDLSILQNQLVQLINATDNEVYDRQKQGERDRAKILISAGEANISGNSLMRAIASNMMDEDRDKDIYKSNLENQLDQGTLEAYKIRTQASQDINYTTSQRVNPFLNGLAVGVPAGVNLYNQYRTNQLQN
jgi:hypothetical protein